MSITIVISVLELSDAFLKSLYSIKECVVDLTKFGLFESIRKKCGVLVDESEYKGIMMHLLL
jgi:hypothetical protein